MFNTSGDTAGSGGGIYVAPQTSPDVLNNDLYGNAPENVGGSKSDNNYIGHDGNISPIDAAVREFRVEHPEFRVAVLEAWWVSAGELIPEDTFEVWGGLGHAGEGETSMMLAVSPELVEMDRARGVVPYLPLHVQVKWNFDELTPYGVTGDPTKATEGKGRLMRDALVELLVEFVGEMDERCWDFKFFKL